VKATFTKSLWKRDLLLSDQYLQYSKYPELFRREALEKIGKEGVKRIFIDEIQRVPLLLNEIHHLIEETGCQFLLTGSSARKLRREGVNLLAGRAVQRRLFPFVYAEIASNFSLEEVLRFGSLPAVFGQEQEVKIDILKSYAEIYLKEEIQFEGLTRNLGNFSRFLDLAASQSGELLSYATIGRECQVAPRTVQSYYEILEDTLIAFRMNPWRKSLRQRLVSHPKFYLFDLGVINALNRQLTAPPDAVRLGRLFEHFIVLETHRLQQYLQSEAALYFWKTNHGAEVDLIIEKNGAPIRAFEIKSSPRIAGPHLSGLRSFRKDFPKVPLGVICRAENPYRIDEIQVLPWKTYLEELPEILKG
jgi:predicted AAA+ superfamily ATPase